MKFKHLLTKDVSILKKRYARSNNLEFRLSLIDKFYPHIEVTIDGKKTSISKIKDKMYIIEFLTGINRAVYYRSCLMQGINGEDIYFSTQKYWNKLISNNK